MVRRKQRYVIKQTEEFKHHVRANFELVDDRLGFKNNGVYCSVYVNITFHGNTLSVPISHLVWLLKYGDWPTDGMHLDHIDDSPINNRWENLAEITNAANQKKRIGKGYRTYGNTKYGHGISIHQDKRDGRYYAERYYSSKEILELKYRKIKLFSAKTLEEIEAKIEDYKKTIDENFFDESMLE